MNLNWKMIANILGLLMGLNGMFMVLGIPFSLYYGDGDFDDLLLSGLITMTAGASTYFLTKDKDQVITK